jgi:hypothetical protein
MTFEEVLKLMSVHTQTISWWVFGVNHQA